jgi:hypothetical protein
MTIAREALGDTEANRRGSALDDCNVDAKRLAYMQHALFDLCAQTEKTMQEQARNGSQPHTGKQALARSLLLPLPSLQDHRVQSGTPSTHRRIVQDLRCVVQVLEQEVIATRIANNDAVHASSNANTNASNNTHAPSNTNATSIDAHATLNTHATSNIHANALATELLKTYRPALQQYTARSESQQRIQQAVQRALLKRKEKRGFQTALQSASFGANPEALLKELEQVAITTLPDESYNGASCIDAFAAVYPELASRLAEEDTAAAVQKRERESDDAALTKAASASDPLKRQNIQHRHPLENGTINNTAKHAASASGSSTSGPGLSASGPGTATRSVQNIPSNRSDSTFHPQQRNMHSAPPPPQFSSDRASPMDVDSADAGEQDEEVTVTGTAKRSDFMTAKQKFVRSIHCVHSIFLIKLWSYDNKDCRRGHKERRTCASTFRVVGLYEPKDPRYQSPRKVCVAAAQERTRPVLVDCFQQTRCWFRHASTERLDQLTGSGGGARGRGGSTSQEH